MTRSVLITGSSSGIGRATAVRLARGGMRVYATARDPGSITDLADAGCQLLALDVTDEESVTEAVAAVERAHGQVDVLVNNAGYGQYGAIEEVPIEDVRRQLETNVVGPVRLIQLVLPGMRAAGGGTIVNVSSMGGGFMLPGGGYYHASKHALEAISDALRFEVGPFGVNVAIIRAPRPRYRVTLPARVLLTLRWLLPDRLWDAALASRFVPAGRTTRG